ncbi:hypothetical protein P43SY_000228 [Pythium insidiosum]|uniref:TPR-like protein n=1 Tax=Pythium insidiosum TaxID=114742 RepID=A0AAD5LSJ3_PYTIN|nr:hypothetical protein P43SY_000228 [Pythium insidiosum]
MSVPTTTAAAMALAAAHGVPDIKTQDVQQAADFYQKGTEVAHAASSPDDYARAIELFSIAIAIRNDQPRFFFARGNAFRAINEFEFAAKDFTAAIALDDRAAVYYANRGACYRKLGQLVAALEDFTAAAEMDGKKGGHFFSRALVLLDAGLFREAIVDFTKTLEDDSVGIRTEYRALQHRGNCYRKLGNLQRCIEDLQAAIKLDSRNSTGFSSLAQAYLDSGDLDHAIEHFSNAIEFNNTQASYYSLRGLCYYRQGPRGRGSVVGLSTHELAAEANGGLSSAHSLSAEDQLDAALADIELAWTLSPKGVRFHIGVGMIKQLKKQYGEASALFRDAHHAARANVVVKYHWALCCHMLHDAETAVTLLCDCADAMPEEPLFVEARGLVLQETGQHELAVADFSHAITLRLAAAGTAGSPWNHYLRAESFLRLEQFESCVQDCTTALELALKASQTAALETSIRNARAMAYRGLGQLELAIHDLTACLALDPENDVFQYHRGLCLLESRRPQDALVNLHDARRANPRDADVLYLLGLCYFRSRDPPACVEFMSAALHAGPRAEIVADAHYHIGLAHALEGDNATAIRHFSSALEHARRHGSPTAATLVFLHERAKALQLERRFHDAIEDFSAVIRENPNNAHAYFRRGFAWKALGQLQAAAADLETAKLLDPSNPKLAVKYKEIRDTECVILCDPGDEKAF